MIDTHIHIVPSVDDGSNSIEVSLNMLRYAKDEGVTKMIVTPHYNIGLYENDGMEEAFDLLKRARDKHNIPIELYLGNEIYLNEENVHGLLADKGYRMAESHYALIELPFHYYYAFHDSLLYQLQTAGIKVVLAHVERYDTFQHKPEKLEAQIKRGIYGQMTSGYIAEKKTRKHALNWIGKGYIHIVASDGHNMTRRLPQMMTAYNIVESKFGKSVAKRLFIDNPQAIIDDCQLISPEIEEISKKIGESIKKFWI